MCSMFSIFGLRVVWDVKSEWLWLSQFMCSTQTGVLPTMSHVHSSGLTIQRAATSTCTLC
ncbi:hypothetical protein HMPREF3214_00125 [Alloscardovia omnicolens]|nr:hypothetical protein HMPREF3214_00125 [Alloscardovia omnicolens]